LKESGAIATLNMIEPFVFSVTAHRCAARRTTVNVNRTNST
jgi:hypothetical protein